MEKLYPPNIAGTLPAFCGKSITIPFSHNRAVSNDEVQGFSLKLKTIQSNKLLVPLGDKIVFGTEDINGFITFTLPDNVFEGLAIGQFYKVQIAYIASDEKATVGYYSTVGTIKYTSEPMINIGGADNTTSSNIHAHGYDYTGTYQSNGDPTEKLYSYCFTLTDDNGQIIKTSGEIIHDGREDEDGTAICLFTINQELEQQIIYTLTFTTTSVNGLVKSTKYKIEQGNSINPELKADLIASLNEENGYIKLQLIGHKTLTNDKSDERIEAAVTGTYKISRAENTDNYKSWSEVMRFALYGQQPSFWSWKDLTIKQGVTYKYSIQQYNDKGLTSNRIESNVIFADFEHSFLYDGERQLKIKFNPQVNNFKNDILESKLDTIGSQYPFIFRNGHVKYKEFQIGGLISALLDNEYLFVSQDFLVNHDQTIDLNSNNIATEREFKLEVLEWLNNGKPKIFRSPTEGNYIIRLLNVALSPTAALGRMLHSFSATAYEIMEWNQENLKENNFFPFGDPTIQQLRWETKDLTGVGNMNLLTYTASSIRLEGLVPGDRMRMTYYTDPNAPASSQSVLEFTIGATGSYIIDLSLGLYVTSLLFASRAEQARHQGTLTYGYYSKAINRFDNIGKIDTQIYPIAQFIGAHDILAEVQNCKVEIQNIYFIKGILRQPYNIYYKEEDNEYYIDQAYKIPLAGRDEINDPYLIFRVYQQQNNEWVLIYYCDGFNGMQKLLLEEYDPCLHLNNKTISIAEKQEYFIKSPPLFTTLQSGNGIILEIAYRQQQVDYAIEDKLDEEVQNLRIAYENSYKNVYNIIYDIDEDGVDDYKDQYDDSGTAYYKNNWSNAIIKTNQLNQKLEQYYAARNAYMTALEQALKEAEEEQGDTV